MKQLQKASEIKVVYKRSSNATEQKISTSEEAFPYILQGFDNNTIGMQEQFVVLYLNRSNSVLGYYKASIGGITGTVADIRIILATALKVLATSIIVAHNHPSGSLQPSRQDEELTMKIKQAAALMEIKLLDHLIISPDKQFYSFADDGWV